MVNDAVYIARVGWTPDGKHIGEWTATGTQFAKPYVFKSLFSHEPIEFNDLMETMTVTTALYLDFNEELGDDEHDYRFVGRAGAFCPVLPGKGGAMLCREKDGKYYAATGTKGYRWLEAETVKVLNRQDDIDISYYKRLADEAVEDISKFGDFEWFVSEEVEPIPDNPIGFNDTPPWLMPCGKQDCVGCPHWEKTTEADGKMICIAGYECLPF